MSAYQSAGGALKLKGVGDLGNKKKKKKKKEAKKIIEQISMIRQSGEDADGESSAATAAAGEANKMTDTRTPAEKAFAKVQEKRRAERVLEKASKKHKDRVNEFNSKLDTLTEHFDIPKVSWTK